MASLVEMDERVSIFAQMDKEEDVKGPVILINKFSIAPGEIDEFLKGWATEAEKFKQQPGYISTNYIEASGRVAHSLTMRYGNLFRTSKRQFLML
jgi:hypothetical protein